MAIYNLQVLRGLSTARSLLSCREDGLVDLWLEDDGSGRQRWELIALPGDGPNVFNIKVASAQAKRFLSCTADGLKVDLFDRDDGSGRQKWVLVKAPAATPQIPAYYTLNPLRGAEGLLSCTPDGTKVDLFTGGNTGRQRWQLQGQPLP